MDKFAIPTVTQVAILLAPDEHQGPWHNEAPVRHAIRRYLLIGCHWTRSWHRADAKAAALVSLARADRKVHLPTGFDSDADLSAWLPTCECICCGRWVAHRFPDQQFCSAACTRRYAEIEEWSIARAGACGPPRCGWCHQFMEVDEPHQKYCNAECRRRAGVIAAIDEVDREFAALITRARRARQIKQGELADRLGISQSLLCNLETGDNRATEPTRQRLLKELGLDEAGNPITPFPPPRTCLWCSDPLPEGIDQRARYCSEEHRRLAGLKRDVDNARERRAQRRMNGNGHENATNGHDPADRRGPASDAPGAPSGRPRVDDRRAGVSRDDAAPTAG